MFKSANLNCIDLSEPDIRKSVLLLKQACKDSGFFYVVNHGIRQELVDEVFALSKRFFDLPLKEKMKLLRNNKHKGYTPILDETLDPGNQVIGDYKEGYYIGAEVPEGDPRAEKPFFGQNIWPFSDVLPGWKETMLKYHQEALEVAKSISKIIALALEVDAEFFIKPDILGDPITTLRLLHYSGEMSNPENGIYGAGPHSDYGLMSLLLSDEVGLQICRDKDAQNKVWEYVQPMKGAFVVNFGDMLERWSNCTFRSTLHRVIFNGQERYSVAFFVEPNHECVVECLPTCKSADNPPKFPPVTCCTYMSQRYKETHADLSIYSGNHV